MKDNANNKLSAVEEYALDCLYHFHGGHAPAIRMFGADDDFVTANRLHVEYFDKPLQIQPELKETMERFIEAQKVSQHEKGVPFFDGPNTRLVQWKASPGTGKRSALEEKELYLTLGPVRWFEYEGLNGAFRERVGPSPPLDVYEYYTNLSRIVNHQDISGSKLSNIVGTATTLLTTDGFVVCASRGVRVTLGGMVTSAVAENINRYLDDADPHNPLSLLNHPTLESDRSLNADYAYRPRGVPHPIAAVRRGLSEELSLEILERIANRLPVLTGICYDLLSAHPDLLFVYALPMEAREVKDLCREHPGKDYSEGRLRLLRADIQDPDTLRALQGNNWIPSGKASVLRTLELLRALRKRSGASHKRIIELLAGCDDYLSLAKPSEPIQFQPEAEAIEYDVALSFAGEDRLVAEKLARLLSAKRVRVFYDKYEQASLWGKDLYQHLQVVYRDKARFCVVFLSKAYANKLWTKHELQQAQARGFEENTEYILPLKVDDTEIPGINQTVGYLDLRSTSIEQVADLLLQKLENH